MRTQKKYHKKINDKLSYIIIMKQKKLILQQ